MTTSPLPPKETAAPPLEAPANIVLIGFMGAGKTSVSQELAKLLDRHAIEMDELIAQRAGVSSVAKIIDLQGEKVFRDLEANLASELGTRSGLVISTGGGIITRPENRAAITQRGAHIVFLDCPFETARDRLSRDQGPGKERPLFRDLTKAKALFDARLPIYREWASFIVQVESLSPRKIAQLIIECTANSKAQDCGVT